MMLKRRKPAKMGLREAPQIRCPSHLKWVRGHQCAATCDSLSCYGKIEAAHVRLGNHAGMGQKPGDDQAIPLCSYHHAKQHAIGEETFRRLYRVDMAGIAADLWQRSPHGKKYRADNP